MNKKKIILKSCFLFIWMVIIFLLSNQKGSDSSNLSNGMLYTIFKTFSLANSLINDYLFVLIRKLAHFTEYLILGILVLNLLKEFKIKNIFIISAYTCLLYATIDEIHQLFINSRSGSIIDVMIDFFGVLVGLFIYYRVMKYKENKIK